MKSIAENQDVAMGIDVAAKHLAVTAMVDGEVVKQATIAHSRRAIESFLARFPGCRIRAAYEAGCFGYWLYDTLEELGVKTIVTPPSLLERAPGDRVKTDRRDSLHLAEQLAAGRLKAVSVPTKEERATRQLVRTYEQLKRMRVSSMVRIRSFLEFHHVEVPPEAGRRWTVAFVSWLLTLAFEGRAGAEFLRRSLDALVHVYQDLTDQAGQLKQEIGRLAKTKRYERAAVVLASTPGVGTLSAMIHHEGGEPPHPGRPGRVCVDVDPVRQGRVRRVPADGPAAGAEAGDCCDGPAAGRQNLLATPADPVW